MVDQSERLDILTTCEILLGITDKRQSSLLGVVLDQVLAMVLEYLRWPEDQPLTDGLTGAVIQLVVKRFRVGGFGSTEAPDVVASVKDHEQTVNFAAAYGNGAAADLAGGLTDAERAGLLMWRRLWTV